MSLARTYLSIAGLWRRLQLAADAAFTGLWLGILDPPALEEVDEELYRTRERYHTREHNLSGLFPWEEEAVRRYFGGARRVLMVAAGGGREAIALARRGHRVEAYECNRALVAAAARVLESLPEAGTLRVDHLPRNAPLPDGPPCDGCIVGWSAYMLVPGREARLSLLRGVRVRMAAGAPILISFFTRGDDSAGLRVIARIADGIRRLRGSAPVQVGDDLAPNFVHRFTLDEVREELAASGFEALALAPEGSGPVDSGWAVGRAMASSTRASRERTPEVEAC